MVRKGSDEILLQRIRKCTTCKKFLPLGPRPILNFNSKSKIIIIGQAPGTKVHESGIPWDDASGERLRGWLGVSTEQFYNPDIFGIVPMGFCYPGRGKSGDNPPRPECAPQWMDLIFKELKSIKLVILIGGYSQKYFLKESMKRTLTETVKSWKEYTPRHIVLPHPSPRNNIWLKKNSWFEKTEVPYLRKYIKKYL